MPISSAGRAISHHLQRGNAATECKAVISQCAKLNGERYGRACHCCKSFNRQVLCRDLCGITQAASQSPEQLVSPKDVAWHRQGNDSSEKAGLGRRDGCFKAAPSLAAPPPPLPAPPPLQSRGRLLPFPLHHPSPALRLRQNGAKFRKQSANPLFSKASVLSSSRNSLTPNQLTRMQAGLALSCNRKYLEAPSLSQDPRAGVPNLVLVHGLLAT